MIFGAEAEKQDDIFHDIFSTFLMSKKYRKEHMLS